MRTCRYWRRRIAEAIYGELDAPAREALERHLAGCEACSGLYEGMASAVRKMAARPAPDRPPDYWEDYWDRLQQRMAREAGTPPEPRRSFGFPRWAYGAAGALAILVLGIFIGRTIFLPTTEPIRAARAVSPEAASFPLRASRYLKRSRVLLLAVINSAPQTEDDFNLSLPLQKKTSEELVMEAAALKKELGSSDRRLERLISDLEMILLQIANLKSDSGSSDIEIIKAGVESRDILFKINLNEARRPAGKSGVGPAPRPGGAKRDRVIA
jgi:Putative zinc-finger